MPPSNHLIHGSLGTPVYNPTNISTGSDVLVQIMAVTDKYKDTHTDHTASVTTDCIYALHACNVV